MVAENKEKKAGVGAETPEHDQAEAAEEPSTETKEQSTSEDEAQPQCPGCAKLQAELHCQISKCEELAERIVRLQADFDNFRRRTRQEKEELVGRAAEGIITRLLPVLDDLDRALATVGGAAQQSTLAEGVGMVRRSLLKNLQDEGLQVLPGIGADFDPNFHEAVARDAADQAGENSKEIVVEEFRKGYQMKGKVLRPAMVKVGFSLVEEA